MQPGTKVYVRWYGRTLEGEVAGSDGFMGMTPVRIPLDGHHPVALFMPQHVYESAELVKGNSPIISQKDPKVDESLTKYSPYQSKVDESLTKYSPYQSKVSPNDCLVSDDRIQIEAFKTDNWDNDRNHLRIDKLDEFYQLWRKTHDRRKPNDEASVICQSHTPKPVPVQPVPQNGTPPNTKQLHKKKPAKAMELSLFD